VLRKIFWSKRDEVKGSVEDYITRSFTVFTPHHMLFGNPIKKNEMGEACSTYGERRGVYRDLVGRT